MEYIRGTVSETGDGENLNEDILDFANMVFSMEYSRIDFATYFPKAYGTGRYDIPVHHIIKEDNKIRGLVDVYPMALRQQYRNSGLEIAADYIGTVAVHHNCRGKGFMTELMARAKEDAIKRNRDIMIVDGNRSRYSHFGFEKAGIKYSFSLPYKNVLEGCCKLYDEEYMQSPVYSFEEADDDSPYIDKMYMLYMRRNVTARTADDFFVCLKGGKAVTYAVFRDDSFSGYVSLSEDLKNILEFETDNDSELPRMIYDLMEGLDIAELGISVGMDEPSKIKYLEKLSEYYNMAMSHQICILNYERVIRFLLVWKQKYTKLSEGEYILGLKSGNDVKNYCITVKNGDVEVKMTDKEADLAVSETEFVKVFTTSYYFMENNMKDMPAGWFPLPFYLPDADTF